MANPRVAATVNAHEPFSAAAPARPSSRLRSVVALVVTLLSCALLVWGAHAVGSSIGNDLRRFQAYPARDSAMSWAGWSLWPGDCPRHRRPLSSSRRECRGSSKDVSRGGGGASRR
jgi:hypothetical protein